MKVENPLPKILAIVLLTVGALLILAYFYVTAGGRLPFSGHLYTVTAQLQDPQGLLKHADVRAAGVKVGSVDGINNDYTPNGIITDVQMQLDHNYTPIYRNATVLVRQKTLVGENYIELTRGTPQAGRVQDGGKLPGAQDLESVPVDKLLAMLTPPVRRELQIDLRSLGAGLHNEGQHLNQFLGALQPTVHNGGVVLQTLNDQRAQLTAVIAQTGTVMQAIANRTQDLRSLITGGTQTAQAVASRDTALAQSLVALPSTLAQARRSVSTLSAFSGLATPVIANLRVAVTNLDPVVRELEPTAAAARRLFNDLPPFLRVANPLLTNLKTFSSAARPAIPGIEALLREANPALAYLQPYAKEIGGFVENFGDVVQKENDTPGDYIGRCLCPISTQSYTGYTPQEQALVQALIKAGGLGGIANPTSNPLRQPGLLPNASQPYSGTYPRISADPPPGLKP
jgi:phospholipid/cholesterol/gamma-HCH transport system substrate-binding protein